MEDLKPLIESIYSEGLGDLLQKGTQAVKGALGIGADTGMFSRDEWGRIMQLADKQVNMLANTPSVKDSLQVINDLFKVIGGDPKIQVKVAKVHRELRDALKLYNTKKDSASAGAVAKIVNQLKQEADKVRATRGANLRQGTEEKNPIDDIAKVVTENVHFNAGLEVEEDDGDNLLMEGLKEAGYIDED
jgi:hypothetical protein